MYHATEKLSQVVKLTPKVNSKLSFANKKKKHKTVIVSTKLSKEKIFNVLLFAIT